MQSVSVLGGCVRANRWAVRVAALVGVTMAVLMGTPSAWAATTDSGTTTVSFNIAEAIEVTSWPAATFSLADGAAPGVAVVSEGLSITVRSNSLWGIQISSDSGDGYLREYSDVEGFIPDGHTVGPVEWATSADGLWTPITSVPTPIFADQPPTGEAGASVGFLLRVTPTYDHQPLPEGREYRIVLVYTAGVGF